ncbi:hypothetical protein G6F22_021371 [Rhizopus arrhizus]|nr:hypothetical protein G6F22_021371 [Rhizopus arrhizus]
MAHASMLRLSYGARVNAAAIRRRRRSRGWAKASGSGVLAAISSAITPASRVCTASSGGWGHCSARAVAAFRSALG